MTTTMCRLMLAGLLWTGCASASFAQAAAAQLQGKWVRVADASPVVHGMTPESEDVAVDSAEVKVTRPGAALRRVTLVPDGVERIDVVNPRKSCRTTWDSQRLVTECRDTSGGPGGGAAPLLFREVRWVDGMGVMVVETTWQSADRSLTVTSKYRKAEQP